MCALLKIYDLLPKAIKQSLSTDKAANAGILIGIASAAPYTATWSNAALLSLAEQHGWQVEQLTPLQATLEEVFVQITDSETAIKKVNK